MSQLLQKNHNSLKTGNCNPSYVDAPKQIIKFTAKIIVLINWFSISANSNQLRSSVFSSNVIKKLLNLEMVILVQKRYVYFISLRPRNLKC